MDTDISHATQAALDEHEARIAAIEDHLGLGVDDEDEDGEDGDGEDTEDGE